MTKLETHTDPIAVIGLGYVGLPLAVEFGRIRPVVGFDIDAGRIAELREGHDRTRETTSSHLADSAQLDFTHQVADLHACTTFIITVPTPIDAHKRPDLTALLRASGTVGAALKPGDTVIYESTVYPGATEDDCVPVLERVSGLAFNSDFTVGYSPERINPGDKAHRLPDILKVTSGSTPEAAERIDALYASIIRAGTYKAQSIRIAEAAKVIENTQRDLNIALVNELAMIFNLMNIDTEAVLQAAGTKWNFLPFRPGLVGGHCIGVDPYYLTHKAQEHGYHPDVILAGRRINDGMGAYVAGKMIKEMLKRRVPVQGARVLILGLTFKENCPDLRNTRVVDVVRELEDYGVVVEVHDPLADPNEARAAYDIDLVSLEHEKSYDGAVLAVAHDHFREAGVSEIRGLLSQQAPLFDLKAVFDRAETDLQM